MDFELSQEQEMIKEMTREFAEKEIKPIAIELDQQAKFPEKVFQKMGKLGLFGIPFPEQYGGSDGDTISYAIAVEEIGKACWRNGVKLCCVRFHLWSKSPFISFGTEAQKQQSVPFSKGGNT